MNVETDTLRGQLQVIQEQQRKRFEQRKNHSKVSAAFTRTSQVIPDKEHHDDLDLKTTSQLDADQRQKHDQRLEQKFKEALPDTRHDDLQSLVDRVQIENTKLKSSLTQTQAQLAELTRRWEDEREAYGNSGGTATQRIIELSKKTRELNAEVASEQNLVRHLQKKLKEATSKVNENKQNQPPEPVDIKAEPGSIENLQAITEQLKEQLKVSSQRKVEYRNECQLLKQELKLSRKVISREVGEEVDTSSLLNSASGGWRGRAQQIITLQNKVNELQKKVKLAGEPLGSSPGLNSAVNADTRQVHALKKLEATKKKSLADSELELGSLKSEYSKLEQQCLALKSRNKTLTADLKSIRERVGSREGKVWGGIQEASCDSQTVAKVTLDASDKFSLEQQNKKLQTQLTKCVNELHSLKEVTQKRSKNKAKQPRSAPQAGPLPPLIPPPGMRGSKQPSPSLNTTNSAGLSIKTMPPENSFNRDMLTEVAHIEKERLSELVLSLQLRLHSSADKMIHTEMELRNARQKITRLEKQVIRIPTRTNIRAGVQTVTTSELEAELEIQRNENEVIKETLNQTRQDKLTDMKLFQDTIRETKQLFVESVKQLQSQQSRHGIVH